jgi:adenylate cyclase, class 2
MHAIGIAAECGFTAGVILHCAMDLAREPLASNVELKARLDRFADVEEICRRLGALDKGTVEQIDTYFSMGNYRLKLRESGTGEHFLIGYSRPDSAEAKKSQYRLQRIENPGATKATLARQWGVKVVVKKTRRWFLWQGRVRIHLDRVEGLGDFLELEAVVGASSGYDEDAAHLDIARLTHDLGITPRDLVGESYATLVRAATTTPAGT